MARLLLNLKKDKEVNQLCYAYDAYNQTKYHFEVPLFFFVSMIVSEQSFHY